MVKAVDDDGGDDLSHLDDDGQDDGQVVDYPEHPPELVLEEDLHGLDLHEVFELLEDTGTDHRDESNSRRIESVEVVLMTSVGVFSKHLQHQTKENEGGGGEMRDAAMDWRVKRVEDVTGVEKVQDPLRWSTLHPTQEAGHKLAEEMSTGKNRGQGELEEEMKNLGKAVLVCPSTPTHPLLRENLNQALTYHECI